MTPGDMTDLLSRSSKSFGSLLASCRQQQQGLLSFLSQSHRQPLRDIFGVCALLGTCKDFLKITSCLRPLKYQPSLCLFPKEIEVSLLPHVVLPQGCLVIRTLMRAFVSAANFFSVSALSDVSVLSNSSFADIYLWWVEE